MKSKYRLKILLFYLTDSYFFNQNLIKLTIFKSNKKILFNQNIRKVISIDISSLINIRSTNYFLHSFKLGFDVNTIDSSKFRYNISTYKLNKNLIFSRFHI